MKITNAELEVVRFAAEDVLATSMFYVADPAAETTGYYCVYGTMAPSYEEEGTWIVGYNPYDKYEVDADTIENERTYNPNAYTFDAYVDPNGSGAYYTKGVSYWELYGNNGQ